MQAKESENPDSFMILQMDYPNTGRMWTGSDTGLIPEVMASGDPLRNGAQMMLENSVTGVKLKEWEYNKDKEKWMEKK